MDHDTSACRRRHHRESDYENNRNNRDDDDNGDSPLLPTTVVENHNLAHVETTKEQQRRRRKRRQRRRQQNDLSFPITVIQVGTILFIIFCFVYVILKHMFPSSFETMSTTDNQDDDTFVDDVTEVGEFVEQPQRQQQEEEESNMLVETNAPTAAPTVTEEIPPLPVWNLEPKTQYDAYGIVQGLDTHHHNDNDNKNHKFWNMAKELREEFASRYGGENAARAMTQRALSTFGDSITATTNGNHHSYPSDLVHIACRMKSKRSKATTVTKDKNNTNPNSSNGVWNMAFGGYSVTVGRGNRFEHSFPFVMERILTKPMKSIGLDLHVRNAAIGGIPSFPYGWCMKNFWDTNPDVVSWDYAMNEAGGNPEGLEAYLRHVTMFHDPPQLIVKDTHMAEQRKKVLQRYANITTTSGSSIANTLLIHTDPAVEFFLNQKEKFRPSGFQKWREWGAPLGAPGQSVHHPAVKEHEMIGWTLSMYYLSALELLVAMDEKKDIVKCPPTTSAKTRTNAGVLPPPMTVNMTTTTTNKSNYSTSTTAVPSWWNLLYGRPPSSQKPGRNHEQRGGWTLRPIHCRTSFEPIVNGDLKSIVVSGTSGDDIALMFPKGRYFYNKGWVMDLSDKEKLAKRKLERYQGLGFVDSKKAFYGMYESGPLTFFLPYEIEEKRTGGADGFSIPKVGDDARLWFSSIVVCEVNEQREYGECQAETDMSYKVSGINATNTIMMDAPGTLYLGKKLCMYIKIPQNAKIASRNEVSRKLKQKEKGRDDSHKTKNNNDDSITGISLELQVINKHVYDKKNACSVSHVVWEQMPPTTAS